MNDASSFELSTARVLFAGVEKEPTDIVVVVSSLLTHLVAGLIIFGVVFDPVTVTNPKRVHYTMRSIEIDMPPIPVIAPHTPEVKTVSLPKIPHEDSSAHADAGSQSEAPPSLHPKTLLQISKDRSVTTEEVPHPLILLSAIQETPAPIIKAAPDLAPASSDRIPKPELFTENATLSDVLIKPVVQAALLVHATTPTPIRIQADAPQRIFETANRDADKKALANIVSLSQMQMPQGTVVLPRVQSDEPVHGGGGHSSVHGIAAGGSDKNTSKRIQLPPNGRFSMVMIGNSLEERYPETANVWSGRLAYTVYLQLGAGKKWILQFSPLPSDFVPGSEHTGRPEAPWPTEIIVPDLPQDSANSDGILVHGILTATGHFKDLAISFPPYLPTKSFVLDCLSKWVFRPATQNGQNIAVEVLVIIPIV